MANADSPDISNNMQEDDYEAPRDQDWFLEELVNMINASSTPDISHFSLTLTVGGFMISGKMISGRRYFDLMAKVLTVGWIGDEDVERVRKYYSSYGDIYTVGDSNNDSPYVPHFIHMEDAKVFIPGANPIPSNEGILWRGRLTAVDGFWMGNLSVG